MKLQIARDLSGRLSFHCEQTRYISGRGWTNVWAIPDSSLFPEVTFENSPQEVKIELEQEINALDLFKKLPHLNGNKEVVDDWEYTPDLYHFDTKWHVSWMHCDDGFAFIGFEGETPEEVIQKAFDWCVELKLIK